MKVELSGIFAERLAVYHMKYWKKLTHHQQDVLITEALKKNINYREKIPLGIPVSKLDAHVFSEQVSFLRDAPLLRTYVDNPNHIGCHTFGHSESFFEGTQKLERDVIELLSVDFFKAAEHGCDGYIATGGTEANIQAAWIYRNYFHEVYNAAYGEIALLASADTHYSASKAANLLNIAYYSISVDDNTRMIMPGQLDDVIKTAMSNGIRCFIVVSNMATTMFGSVDDPDLYARHLTEHGVRFKIHIDAAFGGFIYPISSPGNNINFHNPNVSSITLDAHKMLQAPFGTGIFLVRKGMMNYVCCEDAKYVSGMDITLCGSRSGANAVAVWMILQTYGPFGWLEKINKLLYRTRWLCGQLDELGVAYYHHPDMNIVTLRSEHIPIALAKQYDLVPDSHQDSPCWYKIVVMDHVDIDYLQLFIKDLRESRK